MIAIYFSILQDVKEVGAAQLKSVRHHLEIVKMTYGIWFSFFGIMFVGLWLLKSGYMVLINSTMLWGGYSIWQWRS